MKAKSKTTPPRRTGLPILLSFQPDYSGKVWLLARAQGPAAKPSETEIERWFRELVSKPYDPADFDDEVDRWGAPLAVFGHNIIHPASADHVALLNEGFPGAIFQFQGILKVLIEKSVVALTSPDPQQIQDAKSWLKKVIFPTGDSGTRIGLGVRFIGFYPQLYGEIAYLRRAAGHLLDQVRSQHKVIAKLTKDCNLPPGRITDNWLVKIVSPNKGGEYSARESVLAACILADCIGTRPGTTTGTGYQERMIRSKINILYPHWDEMRTSYKYHAWALADERYGVALRATPPCPSSAAPPADLEPSQPQADPAPPALLDPRKGIPPRPPLVLDPIAQILEGLGHNRPTDPAPPRLAVRAPPPS